MGVAVTTVVPLLSALAAGPVGIGAGRALRCGGVAVIVLQNKRPSPMVHRPVLHVGDQRVGRRLSYCIGPPQLILPPLAAAFGWQAAFLSDARPWRWRSRCSWRASVQRQAAPAPRLTCAGAGSPGGYSGYTGYAPTAARGDSLVLTGLVLTIATWGNVPATMLGAGLAARFAGCACPVAPRLWSSVWPVRRCWTGR